jgi:maltose O-acetyltransferase
MTAFLRYCLYALAEKVIRNSLHPRVRALLLRACGARIGVDVRVEEVHFSHLLNGFRNLTLGDHVYVGPNCLIDLTEPIAVGDRTSISPSCSFLTHADPGATWGNRLSAPYPRKTAPILVGSDSWIGAGAVVLCGVTVGSGSVIGAGAVVTRDVPDDALVAGNPARVVRMLETARVPRPIAP